ncbi:molybdopterin-dependent oxidoreductase [Candidatus Bathyarchaeota archaeon]|nr:molybdopterin-dependent oxidoreductase [Candidatus Bathyarchaeota archaeon]MBT4319447.1 molybdopterin-dependent oxidoreductase [Candidatus Bathyarchaeota archaeon]MBT4422915.1 molybdopterin-dependent oxidoreductase [Candidatus Bathyarchaeota archaeon]MBT6605617.1 molybdopterin-dependent oxidoreductase [Candidatus Bathyarchaeota archaeon]MBT7346321.1 molybdopterin-dependent oxidoreductase [Candidatus Bathyarchaeota archaeon]
MQVENKIDSDSEKITHGACYMCDMYCPTKVHVKNGKAVKIEMLDKKIKNLCPRWKAQLEFVYNPERIIHPLKRVGERGEGIFKKISWDEALDTIADKLTELKSKYGAKATAFYIAYTQEPRPYFRRLTYLYGSPNYCTETSSCFSASWLAASLNFGEDYGYFLPESRSVSPETKSKIIWSSSIRQSSPHFWQDHIDAIARGMKLIVVDPRETRIASMADIHLQLRPGTDGALALGMMNVIINEELYDKEFVENWTTGFNELREYVQEYSLEQVEEITWVPSNLIIEAARMFASNTPGKIHTSPAATIHHLNGVQNTRAIYLLTALTGSIEVPGGNRQVIGRAPGKDISMKDKMSEMGPGLGSEEFPLFIGMFKQTQSNALVKQINTGKPYPIKALIGAGLNVQFFANQNNFVKTMKKLDLIVDIDFFQTPATRISDIVLPISSWLERPILLYKSGGQIKLIEPAIDPVGETWHEWKIYAELAKRLGFQDQYWYGDIDRCFNDILEPSGLNVSMLRESPEGITLPVAKRSTKYYEENGFQTPSGKVEMVSSILAENGYEPLPVYREPVESPISSPDLFKEYPLVFTSGARRINFTHSQHRNIKSLRKMMPEPLLEINPEDAKLRSINDGDKVSVTSPRGEVIITAMVTPTMMKGVVQMPHHWPDKANANNLSDDKYLDPISGFPAFKSQLCQVTKIT